MLRNYLAAALRNLARNRLQTFLNVAGLAMGLFSALLALLYVQHELSYDRFIPGNDKIYVMVTRGGTPGHARLSEDMGPAYLGTWMRSEFPGVEVARLMPGQLSVRHGDIETLEKIGWADANLFSLLRLPVVAGDLATALQRPDGVVITRRMARKYFGRSDPIGETLELNRKVSLQVMAVIEDLPEATHLAPDIYGAGSNLVFGITRLDALPYRGNINTEVYTYVAVPQGGGQTIADLQAAMPDFVRRHFKQILASLEDLRLEITLVPLSRLHMFPNDAGFMKPHGDPAAVTAIGVAGLLIVLVAVVNFVNLMTARSARRAVEVGVRKVSGAAALHLIAQFIGEALVYAVLGMTVALVAVDRALPVIAAKLVPGLAERWVTWPVMTVTFGLVVFIGLIGGAYPAFVLSTYHPTVVLKGRVDTMAKSLVREVLVALQFGVLIILMLATLVIYRQTVFSLRDGLRVQHGQILMVYAPCRGAFIDAVQALPGVSAAACSRRDPLNLQGYNLATRGDDSTFSIGIAGVGFGFFELYGVQPIAGRLFDPARDHVPSAESTTDLAVLNESAVRAFGFASADAAVGQVVNVVQRRNGPPAEIVGVVPDFTFDLMSIRVTPMIYWVGDAFDDGSVLYFKLSGHDMPEIVDTINALWKRVGEPRPIRQLFVDQDLQDRYTDVIRQGNLICGLSVAAILIACFGLFGLAAFTAERRTKEIGVRKAMGAGRSDILRLLLWEFAKPVLWANVIAWPVAYAVMHRWLEGFAYHVNLAPWMFLAASALALTIALITVSGHALLVARAKPASALRYE